jgi:hypothetical protein
MPRKSRSTPKKRRGSRRQNHNDQEPLHFNQSGGNGLLEGAQNQAQNQAQTQGKVEISQATLNQAGQIAQQFLEKAMAGNAGQKGGSASGAGGEAETATATEGLKTAIMEGAVAGANAGAVAAAEGYSSLKGAPLMGGRRSKGRRHGRRGRKSQHQNHTDLHPEQNQKGGMVPGLMTAVETALVPLGLYLGQKALQSRRSGNRSLGNSFDFRQVSRRTRRRR